MNKAEAKQVDAMPKWVPRAIVLFFAVQLAAQFLVSTLSALRGFLVTVIVSLFLSFALEPAVNALNRRGMRRGLATAAVFLGLIVVVAVFMFAIASLVVDQLAKLSDNAPKYLEDVQNYINKRFDANIDTETLREQIENSNSPVRRAIDNFATNAFSIGSSAVAIVFQMLTVGLFTFYFVADAPKLRRSLLRRLPRARQEFVLSTWEMAIDKTGGYIYSRALLALLSGICHWIFFEATGVPYAVALAVWVGLLSQFIPVVGTYLAGILPVTIALIDEPKTALFVLIFIVIYQQIENYFFAPRITAKTMDMHPAVAFAAVIIGVSVFGPAGAFLSLPAAAMIQAFASLYLQDHEVIESSLTTEPERVKKKN